MDELDRSNDTGSIGRARALRRQMTEAERALWCGFVNEGLPARSSRRQVPIRRFVADFACVEKRLFVEVDDGQHAASKSKDLERSMELAARGYVVLRFWNNDVLQNLSGVLTEFAVALRKEKFSLPEGEEGTRAAGG